MKRDVEIGEKRGERRQGVGAIIGGEGRGGEERRTREGLCGVCMWDTAAHILFSAFFLFFLSLLPSHHLCPQAAGLIWEGLAL